MNEAVESLDTYSTYTKILEASAFVIEHCCVNAKDDILVLKQLQKCYVADLVKIFIILNRFDYLIQPL